MFISTMKNLFFSWLETGADILVTPKDVNHNKGSNKMCICNEKQSTLKKRGEKGVCVCVYIYSYTHKDSKHFLSLLTINTLAENMLSCGFWISLTFSNI